MTKRGVILILATLLCAAAAVADDLPASIPAALSRGVELYGQGKWHEAVLELKRAASTLTAPADSAEALYWISLAQIGAGEYGAAARDLDALIAIDPSGKRANEASYQKGRALFHLGRYDDAIVTFKTYSDFASDEQRKSAAAYWVGECLYALGRLDDARSVFALVVERYPASLKYEASSYRIALIDQKAIETELLKLLKWSHEESLRTVEEYQRRERSYEQAILAYQKRIAEMLQDGRLGDLERENRELAERLAAARGSTPTQSPATTPPAMSQPPSKTPQADPPSGDNERVTRLLDVKAKALELQNQVQKQLEKSENEGAK